MYLAILIRVVTLVGVTFGLLIALILTITPVHAATTIISPSPEPFARFGSSIDSSNGLLAVGSSGATLNGVSVGRVWIFDAMTGSLVRNLTSPNPQRAGLFGWSVRIAGHLLLVGAPGESVNGSQSAGRVYVFNAKSGELLKTLVSPNAEIDGFFGAGLAQENGFVYVAASIESVDGVHAAGHVYVFSIHTGSLISTFVSPNPQVGGVFGIALAVSEGRLIVGADEGPMACYPTFCSGAQGRAYVFNATSGSLTSTLLPIYPSQYFGNAVAILKGQAFVGAPAEMVNGLLYAGRVYVYNATTGSVIRTLISPNSHPEGEFGVSIALAGNNVIIGAPDEVVDGSPTQGQVYVFTIATGALTRVLFSPTAGYFAQFGLSVEPADSHLFIGAPGQTVNGENNVGAVYIFGRTTGSDPFTSGQTGLKAAV